jgi:hypothetical protein
MEGIGVTRLVYIGGFGQSGTTLIESLLTANPDVVACGEVVNGFQGRSGRELKCSCRKSAKDCPIWGVLDRGSNAPWSHDALVLTLLEHVESKYRVLCDSSKTTWGSITTPFRFKRLLGPKFFLLHVVRDPRGVCWSAMRLPQRKTVRKKRRNLTERLLSRPIPRCLRTTIGWWVANLSCELFGWFYPAQYVRLRYEDVARAPHKALYGLLNAISPDLSVRLAEPGANDNRHQIYGNPMRRQRLLFADVRFDDGWKSEMAPQHRWLAGALTWPLRTRYGY